MIDTHCHLTSREYAAHGGPAAVIERARGAGVHGMITVAVSSSDARAALALAREHEGVWCTAGLHPLYADESDLPGDLAVLEEIAGDDKCVAWGELGLDNHYEQPPRPLQDTVLAEQLAFIESRRAPGNGRPGIDKPVIVHCREAFDELIPIFRSTSLDPTAFVFHCFTGTADDARLVLDFGAWISFTGVVTFRNAGAVADAARLVPDDRIMVETDAPYLTPEPHRKLWPNEPQYVVHTARRLAELRGVDASSFAEVLDANARAFFGV